jgi:hypothetical protein
MAAPRRHCTGSNGACDLVHFNSIGAHGVVLGPGSLDVAHKPDEFVGEDEFVRSSLIYYDTARELLRRATTSCSGAPQSRHNGKACSNGSCAAARLEACARSGPPSFFETGATHDLCC